jgi:5-methylcytosine-specific restriction endonuclease McrA
MAGVEAMKGNKCKKHVASVFSQHGIKVCVYHYKNTELMNALDLLERGSVNAIEIPDLLAGRKLRYKRETIDAPKRPLVKRSFYKSPEWLSLRYQALKQNGAKCQCCGATSASGVTLHVDHIRPRSKAPHLQLELSNLQILCEDCNLGKSNKDDTDWRPVNNLK